MKKSHHTKLPGVQSSYYPTPTALSFRIAIWRNDHAEGRRGGEADGAEDILLYSERGTLSGIATLAFATDII